MVTTRKVWEWVTLLSTVMILCTGVSQASAAGGGGMGGGVIDPPPGAPLVDIPTLPNTSNTPGVVEVSLEAKVAPVTVNGVAASLMTYNGSFPGPLIRVKRGDTLRVHFRNSLPYTTDKNTLGFTRGVTNLHVHGMHVSPKEPADAAHITILPTDSPAMTLPPTTYLGTYDYEYDLSMQDPGCLDFYHCHSHGLVAEQYWAGMVGPIVVEDPTPALAGLETHILVLKDISLSGTAPAPHSMMMDYMQGKEGGTVTVNGQVNPVVSIKPGQVQRWRVLNASNARFYKLSLEGHSLYVIGTDGGLLDKAYPQSYVVLSPGERLDLLVKQDGAFNVSHLQTLVCSFGKTAPDAGFDATCDFNEDGHVNVGDLQTLVANWAQTDNTNKTYRLLSLPYSRMGMMTSGQITLMTMVCRGPAVGNAIPASIDPGARRLAIDTSSLPTRTYVLSMSMGRGYINSRDFDVMPDETHSMLGTYEVWEIVNQSNMDHPWHQHVNAAQVLSITGGDAAYSTLYTTVPARKDVTLVPKGGSVRLLVPVMDWPGMTMYHCHILEHEDIGMMGMWHIMGDMGGM